MIDVNPSPRVLIIGLDGATWDLLKPLIDRGKLPYIKSLMENGSHGVLMSTIPPVTASAWSSFYTGRNPGRHGVFDFRRRMGSESTKRSWVTHHVIKGPLLWDIFSAQDKTVGLTNLPLTFPPKPVNGYIIGGMPVPPTRDDIGLPVGLVDEIIRETGEYISDIDLMRGESPDVRDPETCEKFVDQVRSAMVGRMKALLYLFEKYPKDLTACVIVAPDRLSHLFWKVMVPRDEDPPLEEWEIELKAKIEDVLVEMDNVVRELASTISDDDLLVIMSDHGFGPLDQILKTNQLLQQNGYLSFKKEVTDSFRKKVGRVLPEGIKKLLRPLMGGGGQVAGATGSIPGWDPYALLDWENTRAYSGGSVEQGIFLNVKGREPHGIVLAGGEYHNLRDEIISRLKSLKHPDGGLMFDWVEPRENVYSGESLNDAPDIMYCLRDHSIVAGEDAEPPLICPWSQPRAGFHRREGIIILKGPMIISGVKLEKPSIADVAPTILTCCGLKLDEGMDGTIIRLAIEENFMTFHPPKVDTFEIDSGEGTDISGEDSGEMEDLLKGLGYLN
jgi:predicted AlkP superfamily phosphohydrolase/phosphomutase